MKVRVKYKQQRVLISLEGSDDSIYLSALKNAIKSKFHFDFPSESVVDVSLNGKDVLLEDGLTLKDLGIVSGDLVFVITPSDDGNVQNQKGDSEKEAEVAVNEELPVDKVESHMPEDSPKSNKKHKVDGDDEAESAEVHQEGCQGAASMDVEESVAIDPEVNRYLSEPMLCRDATSGQVPQRLVLLYQDADVQNVSDALSVVLHLLMLETGLLVSSAASSSDCDYNDTYSVKMPSDWKSPGAYHFFYTHTNISGVTFKMICVALGRKIVVHGHAEIPGKDGCSLQMQINIEEYVLGLCEDPHKVYKNLPKLSQIFKDKICYRLIEDSRQMMELPQLTGFSGLFPELKLAVLTYLDFRSLVRMSETCSELKTMARDNSLWRRLYLLEFGIGRRTDQSLHQDWLKFFKDEYKRRREREEMSHRIRQERWPPYPYHPGFFGPPLPYAPGAPTGIIGGDYDIDPFGFRGNVPRPFGPYGPSPPNFPGMPGNNRPSRRSRGRGGFNPGFPPFFM